MSQFGLQEWTGVLGISIFVLSMLVMPLYFIYSGAPPTWNVLSRILINLFVCVAVIIFFVCLRSVILQARPEQELLATLSMVFGIVFAVLTLVANSIEAGSVLGSTTAIDPTRIGSGAEGSLLIYGPIARLITATLLIVTGLALAASGLLPMWISWLGYVVAAFHLALIPTIFSKTDPAHFYSVNGWGIPVAGGLFLTWLLVTGIMLITNARH